MATRPIVLSQIAQYLTPEFEVIAATRQGDRRVTKFVRKNAKGMCVVNFAPDMMDGGVDHGDIIIGGSTQCYVTPVRVKPAAVEPPAAAAASEPDSPKAQAKKSRKAAAQAKALAEAKEQDAIAPDETETEA